MWAGHGRQCLSWMVVDDNFGSGGALQGHINGRHSDPRTTPDAN
jgi:hypothetical protein